MNGAGGIVGTGGSGAFGGFGAFGGHPPLAGTGGSGGCQPMELDWVDHHTASVMLVVGRNASMDKSFSDNDVTRKMTAVAEAITMTVDKAGSNVAVGYQDFPDLPACSGQNSCCLGSAYPPMLFSPNTPSKFKMDFGPCPGLANNESCVSTSEARPVSQALQAVGRAFQQTHGSSSIDFFVVLLVDGAPGCSNPGGPPSDCADELSAVSTFVSMGTKFFVVAIGSDAISDPCLKMMASAANPTGSSPTVAPFQPASDASTLTPVLTQISKLAAESWCTFDLPLDHPPAESTVRILVHAQEVAQHDSSNPNGWAFTAPGSLRIKLYGDSCTNLLKNSMDLKVIAGCR